MYWNARITATPVLKKRKRHNPCRGKMQGLYYNIHPAAHERLRVSCLFSRFVFYLPCFFIFASLLSANILGSLRWSWLMGALFRSRLF
jgi:hypothetical protein